MWPLPFISEDDFAKHLRETIRKYGDKLEPFDLKKFNQNLIDPIKLIFDKTVYNVSWDDVINSEIFRQRDKSNNNSIGYFHQGLFRYFAGCEVPKAGWDVIFRKDYGIVLPCGDTVSTVYVEMKNKHNTMNSSAAGKTYIKMQNQLLEDDDCACYLVEAIAKKSQNMIWAVSVDGRKVSHRLIRRVSMDHFYALITGMDDAFYQMCMVLPHVIKNVMDDTADLLTPHDTVLDELRALASEHKLHADDMAMAMASYMLGFSSYKGFSDDLGSKHP